VGNPITKVEKEEAYKDMKHILGIISNLYSPLSINALSTLLDIKKERIEQSLLNLHSVLEVSDNDK